MAPNVAAECAPIGAVQPKHWCAPPSVMTARQIRSAALMAATMDTVESGFADQRARDVRTILDAALETAIKERVNLHFRYAQMPVLAAE